MSKFPLKEAKLVIRDMEVRVRELTHEERNKFLAAMEADKRSGAYVVAACGTVDPVMTVEEAKGEPGVVIEEIVEKIMEISGMQAKRKTAQKEPDAR